MDWLYTLLRQIQTLLNVLSGKIEEVLELAGTFDERLASIELELKRQAELLAVINKNTTPPTPAPAVSAVGSVIARNAQGQEILQQGDGDMNKKATSRYLGRKFSGEKAATAGSDVAVQDDGTLLYSTTALDAKGNPTAWPTGGTVTNPVVTDPSTVAGGPYLGVTLNAQDATNASLIGTPQNVNPAPAGALPDTGIGVTATVTFPNIAPFTVTYPLIDVVAGPANTAVGQVSANNPAT
jgi:hypothetical protein